MTPRTPDSDSKSKKTETQDDDVSGVLPTPWKTPLYQAMEALRYQRQALIKKIQDELSHRKLICYVGGDQAGIDRDDTLGFVDLLHNIPAGCDLDLLLHTVGGDIDAAEKLITMVRKKVGAAILRIVVPDYAKSAGTLMSLGADIIVMSDSSELGPIDPQIIRSDDSGNQISHSMQTYLNAYKLHSDAVKKDPNDLSARIMLSKIDPATVEYFDSIMKRARKFAEDQLKQGMLKDGNWSQAASELIDTNQWKSHGQMISWEHATSPKIGLKVEYLPPDNSYWSSIWQLYCLQRFSIGNRQKLFESDFVSIPLDSPSR